MSGAPEDVVVPDGVGGGGVVVRVVARAFSRRSNPEAAGQRPVDVLRDQRRLIPPRHRVADAVGRRLPREEGARHHVALHGRHHHVLPLADRPPRVRQPRARRPRALHHHIDVRGAELRHVLGEVGRAVAQRRVHRRRTVLLRRPARRLQRRHRVGLVQVGDGRDLDARRGAGLGEVHGAELAGADEANADGVALGGARLQPLDHVAAPRHLAASPPLTEPAARRLRSRALA